MLGILFGGCLLPILVIGAIVAIAVLLGIWWHSNPKGYLDPEQWDQYDELVKRYGKQYWKNPANPDVIIKKK